MNILYIVFIEIMPTVMLGASAILLVTVVALHYLKVKFNIGPGIRPEPDIEKGRKNKAESILDVKMEETLVVDQRYINEKALDK